MFIKGSPRQVDVRRVKEIIAGLSGANQGKALTAGLFRDESVEKVAAGAIECGLDCVQLQGEEPPDVCGTIKQLILEETGKTVMVIKAFKVRETIMLNQGFGLGDYKDADFLVFDTYHPQMPGGTGIKFDWKVLQDARDSIEKPFFLAGGLGPANVSEAVKAVTPFGVDVSSGIESGPGKKDEKLLKEFIKNAKDA